MATEIVDLASLEAWLADRDRNPAVLVGLDLRAYVSKLSAVSPACCILVGGTVTPVIASQAAAQGATLLGRRGDVPFDMYRPDVYGVADIYAGFDPAIAGSWAESFDQVAYLWFMEPVKKVPKPIDFADTIAARVHDAAMERSVLRFLRRNSRPAVAVMGGHDRDRTDAGYLAVAKLARDLARQNRMIVTGGGPGFMEAANLGAFLAPFDDCALDDVMAILTTAPRFAETHKWLSTACEVRRRLLGDWKVSSPAGSDNLGIPTWLYGHEPPNLFATHIGKFFYNSLREDGLVTVADGGIIFAEGNAGTVQEVFQDATQNYYRAEKTAPTPIVLFNSTPGFWDLPCDQVVDRTQRKPLLPLLRQLAGERAATVFDEAVCITDDPAAIVSFLLDFMTSRPRRPRYGARPRSAELTLSTEAGEADLTSAVCTYRPRRGDFVESLRWEIC